MPFESSIIDIPNSELPVASRIREILRKCDSERKAELLEGMSEQEFVDYRVDIYLDELERALQSNCYTPDGVEEVAFSDAVAGL